MTVTQSQISFRVVEQLAGLNYRVWPIQFSGTIEECREFISCQSNQDKERLLIVNKEGVSQLA